MIGIEVNSVAYFPKLQEYCPSAQGSWAIFPQLCHASPTVWNSLPQTVISDLTVTTGTFKNRLKYAPYGRAFLQ